MNDAMATDGDALARLDGLAAALLPGNDTWPGGGTLELGRRMLLRAVGSDRLQSAIDAYLALRDPGLTASATVEDRTSALRTMQEQAPELFGVVMASVYDAYYTHPQVLKVVGARGGVRRGSPQPDGHVLRVEPYRDGSRVRDAGVRWRDDQEPVAQRVRDAQEADPDRVWSEEDIKSWSR